MIISPRQARDKHRENSKERWDFRRNPPPAVLGAELEKNTAFALILAQCLPRVTCSEVESLPLGDGCTRLRVTMRNEGFLPSYACNQGFVSKAVPEEAVVTLTLGEGQELMTGDKRVTVPHLEGRAQSTFGRAPLNPFMANSFAVSQPVSQSDNNDGGCCLEQAGKQKGEQSSHLSFSLFLQCGKPRSLVWWLSA
jgi:hypothetical protein